MNGLNDYLATMFDFHEMTPAEIEARNKEIDRLEAEQKARELDAHFLKSGVPERYLSESLKTFVITNEMQKRAATLAVQFINDVKIGNFKTLCLIGKAGTGKTHLASAIIRECGGLFRNASEITEELRRSKSFNAIETEAGIILKYGREKLLVIDEIGRNEKADEEKFMLYQIINARYNTRRPTVLISNFSKADFLQYVGIASADRLLESAEILELDGESYRKNLRAKNDR